MQIQLTEEQLQSLRDVSSATGNSLAELVRQGVELYLSSQRHTSRAQQLERALSVAGRYASGGADGSIRHDDYLAEAFRK